MVEGEGIEGEEGEEERAGQTGRGIGGGQGHWWRQSSAPHFHILLSFNLHSK